MTCSRHDLLTFGRIFQDHWTFYIEFYKITEHIICKIMTVGKITNSKYYKAIYTHLPHYVDKHLATKCLKRQSGLIGLSS